MELARTPTNMDRSWWFASTAIPLLAATTGPMSNVLSIAALVTPWRVSLPDNGTLPAGADDNGVGIPDPHWSVSQFTPPVFYSHADAMDSREIILNACSLAFGFAGNFFLMLNFTGRVRYIISLPLSILFWFLASGIVGHSHLSGLGAKKILTRGSLWLSQYPCISTCRQWLLVRSTPRATGTPCLLPPSTF